MLSTFRQKLKPRTTWPFGVRQQQVYLLLLEKFNCQKMIASFKNFEAYTLCGIHENIEEQGFIFHKQNSWLQYQSLVLNMIHGLALGGALI